MATELVQLSFNGPIATIVLNRAAKLNALNAEMLDALEAYADELDRNQEARVVLLAATGKAFCVGADIYEWSDLSPSGNGPALDPRRTPHFRPLRTAAPAGHRCA